MNCISIINLFTNCSSLEYINISNFKEGNELNNDNMFNGVPNNLVFCSNNEENIPKILTELKIKLAQLMIVQIIGKLNKK